MKASVDKFGRYRGSQPKISSGPPGIGFILDKEGNYDIMGKRLTNIGKATDDQDAASFFHFKEVHSLLSHNNEVIWDELPWKLPAYLTAYIEKNKNEKIVPLVKEINADQFAAVETKQTSLQKELSEFKKNKDKWEKEMASIKKDTQAELKALSDVTRAFVYKITSPSFQRNTEAEEIALRQRNTDKPWRHLFPEITSETSSMESAKARKKQKER